jgi:PhnB protein
MQLNPYLSFNGQCETAFQFYERDLGGKIAFEITYGESPMAKETPKERHNQILHARFEVDGKTLMGVDCPPERYEKPAGFSVTISPETPEKAERIFAALSEKAKVHMPLQETFWAHRFGVVTDQFTIPWMINCEKIS